MKYLALMFLKNETSLLKYTQNDCTPFIKDAKLA